MRQYMPDINERLRQAVVADGRTNVELAKRIGVDRKTLGDWLNCKSNPPLIPFVKLCAELRVSPNYIIYGKE